jgi:hypothetical protein
MPKNDFYFTLRGSGQTHLKFLKSNSSPLRGSNVNIDNFAYKQVGATHLYVQN